jgi:L-aspartate oxidase
VVVGQLERLASDLRIAAPIDTALAFEQRNLLDVAEVIISAAEFRTESRGAHYRSDHPERNDKDWTTNVFVTREADTVKVRKQWVNADWSPQEGDIRIKPWG